MFKQILFRMESVSCRKGSTSEGGDYIRRECDFTLENGMSVLC